MWIFDSYFKGCVELWGRERGLVRTSVVYPPSFYMHLKDPHAHWEMIQALESRFRVEECSFIFGTFEGHRIYASRKVAEKDLFPCGDHDESRFSPDFEIPLSIMGVEVAGDPNFQGISPVSRSPIERKQKFEGQKKVIILGI